MSCDCDTAKAVARGIFAMEEEGTFAAVEADLLENGTVRIVKGATVHTEKARPRTLKEQVTAALEGRK